MLEKIKRQICLWLCFLFMLAGWTSVRAEEDAAFSLHARSAVLMDGDSGRILYGKEPDTPLAMASTTKIMTCILALELGSGNQICTASANAAAQPQVKLGMREAEQFYLQDLLYSLMLESHNDTAVCIAESVAGSVEAFTGKMNEKAAGIGCRDTCFLTPNGLDAGEENGDWHHTTAADLAEILRYCITESPKAAAFLKVTQTVGYSFSNVEKTKDYDCVNHNAFLTMMDGALTGKTGFTAKAGYCYVGALQDEGRLYIVSLLACGWPGHKSWKWSDIRSPSSARKWTSSSYWQYRWPPQTGTPHRCRPAPAGCSCICSIHSALLLAFSPRFWIDFCTSFMLSTLSTFT